MVEFFQPQFVLFFFKRSLQICKDGKIGSTHLSIFLIPPAHGAPVENLWGTEVPQASLRWPNFLVFKNPSCPPLFSSPSRLPFSSPLGCRPSPISHLFALISTLLFFSLLTSPLSSPFSSPFFLGLLIEQATS